VKVCCVAKMTDQKKARAKEVPEGHPGRRAYLIAYINEMLAELTLEQLEIVVPILIDVVENWDCHPMNPNAQQPPARK